MLSPSSGGPVKHWFILQQHYMASQPEDLDLDHHTSNIACFLCLKSQKWKWQELLGIYL